MRALKGHIARKQLFDDAAGALQPLPHADLHMGVAHPMRVMRAAFALVRPAPLDGGNEGFLRDVIGPLPAHLLRVSAKTPPLGTGAGRRLLQAGGPQV